MNILDLPSELLEKIISFVPDQLTVGQISRRFYNISCSQSSFKMEISRRCGEARISIKDIENDETLYRSIINSARKVQSITLKFFDDPFKHDVIGKLLGKFKKNILVLELSKCWLSLEDFTMLGLLSNLQTLNLRYVSCGVFNIPRDFIINLSKLTTINFIDCSPSVLIMFNHLPDNVLRKVYVNGLNEDLENDLFRNQEEIHQICWYTPRRYAIDTHKPKLTSLSLQGVLTNNSAAFASLTSLWCYKPKIQDDIETISTLHQLQKLHFGYDSFLNLSSLGKLQKLQKLKISDDSESFESLITLKSFSVINLKIHAEDLDEPEVANAISLNCPNVQKFEYPNDMNSASFNFFLKGFTKLENFRTGIFGGYTFEHGLKPGNLQHLCLWMCCSVAQLEPLLKSCNKLEQLLIDEEANAENLRIILTARPNMRHLCFVGYKSIEENFFTTFEAMGKNIETLDFKGSSGPEITEEDVKKQLKEIEEYFLNSALIRAIRAKNECSCLKDFYY